MTLKASNDTQEFMVANRNDLEFMWHAQFDGMPDAMQFNADGSENSTQIIKDNLSKVNYFWWCGLLESTKNFRFGVSTETGKLCLGDLWISPGEGDLVLSGQKDAIYIPFWTIRHIHRIKTAPPQSIINKIEQIKDKNPSLEDIEACLTKDEYESMRSFLTSPESERTFIVGWSAKIYGKKYVKSISINSYTGEVFFK